MAHVEVTQQHIDNGKRLYANACPIYLAAKDAGIHVTRVSYTDTAYLAFSLLEGSMTTDYVDLPYKCLNFMRRFDALGNNAVKPFSFDVDLGINEP